MWFFVTRTSPSGTLGSRDAVETTALPVARESQ
jgi:hypothetical protein